MHAQGLVLLEHRGWVLHANHLGSPLPKGALQHKAGLGPRQAGSALHMHSNLTRGFQIGSSSTKPGCIPVTLGHPCRKHNGSVTQGMERAP